jgi:hypothetical protein
MSRSAQPFQRSGKAGHGRAPTQMGVSMSTRHIRGRPVHRGRPPGTQPRSNGSGTRPAPVEAIVIDMTRTWERLGIEVEQFR